MMQLPSLPTRLWRQFYTLWKRFGNWPVCDSYIHSVDKSSAGSSSNNQRSCLKLNPVTGAFSPTSVCLVEESANYLYWKYNEKILAKSLKYKILANRFSSLVRSLVLYKVYNIYYIMPYLNVCRENSLVW